MNFLASLQAVQRGKLAAISRDLHKEGPNNLEKHQSIFVRKLVSQ